MEQITMVKERDALSTVRIRVILLGFLACLSMLPGPAHAARTIVLAAAESQPYIGEDLPGQGYAAELARQALRLEGYAVDIRFYPAARAQSLAKAGKVDGLLPVGRDAVPSENYLLSAPFPGANVGFLKKKTLALNYSANASSRPETVLRSLTGMRIGAVRGAVQAPEFERADYLQREFVADDLQNLDKLALGRLDLIVIDKYRAGDLMTSFRPHLVGKLEFLNPPLFQSEFHVAFAKAAPAAAEYKAAFDRGVAKLRQQGEIERLIARHGLNSLRQAERQSTLTIATVNNPDMLVMKRLSQQFEKQNPGVRLDWRVLDEHTLRRRLMTDLALGDGQFDVMTIGSLEAPQWAANGWIKPLDDLTPAYDLGDILPPVRESLSFNGKPHALPFYAESSMTYYRTDLFRQARVTMPERPSYSDIARLAAALHNPKNGIHGICLRGKAGWGDNVSLVTTMVNSFGGRWFDAGWQPEINQPAWEKAVSLYVDLVRQYAPPDALNKGYVENLQLFADGRCAMWIDATVAAGVLFNPRQSRVAGKVAFVRAPSQTTSEGSAWLWVWAMAIPESSPNKALARRFIEWATSAAYIRGVARSEGWVAVPPGTRHSTYATEEYRAAAPFAEFVGQAILSTQPKPAGRQYSGIQWVGIPEFPAIGHLVGDELAKAVAGRQSVGQSLQAAQAGVERLMREAGYLKSGGAATPR